MPDQASNLNLVIVQRFWEGVWNQGRLELIEELMAEHFTLHSAGTPIGPRPAFTPWVQRFRGSVTELHFSVDDLFASDDKVVTRWRIEGKHNGLLDLPPTGQPVAITGITIFRLADGKIQEGWVERSAFELYQRLQA